MSKPSIPKGTRDFLPEQMAARNYIFDSAKTVFQKFGFLQIETPVMENLSTLTGKYGDEGDQLMFKVLNRGDKFKKAVANAGEDSKESSFSELALRYDLTVPFARFVVQHQNDITYPFKRFQIQPVWRADRPQKGRYREFFQCDVDVVGSDSLLCEVELVQIFNEVLNSLRIPDFLIKINNRKILSGIAEVVGEADKIVDITVAIDKLDKIGLEKVNEEMLNKGVSQRAIDQLKPIIELSGSLENKISVLKNVLSTSEIGIKGIEEIEYIFNYCKDMGADANLVLDITLARGLNYYTGAIFEVEAKGFKGSICGGGRYDGLTDLFGLKGVSGVGISFGADRIYDLMMDLDLFPKDQLAGLDVLFVNFGEAEERYSMKVLSQLREQGVSAEIFPSSAKMKKQMNYANNKGVKYVVMIGSDEIEKNLLRVKNMETGDQSDLKLKEFIDQLK